ncbi:hypothetical protein ETB97_008238 [Aspergillus alliaceus]|uniref:DNA mismatch repair protein S5 domain-containing protein n=1 Tax=Petromyces alliaceus TaxID=209559 RepID=A0A8H6E9D1_PETAA|nr:hypothetical protein ETB97_008238 [Aspergillus burnettii]
MPITALPPTTVRAIGSTSVISDPCSVVKELLDNALDASAASIGIEISPNTVDVIQVKDNGHGIPSSDHGFVCKPAFTSKIQTVEDLRNLGGKSLGFRGEALASAAEVSGGVTVTTRVEAEFVGTSIKYGRNGELISSQRASHPVGTTVRIIDLFKHIPVRRQTALKNATKTLARIKKLIQAYAMAQPLKRLSLKVLKAKNENNNWIYAPARDATIIGAAFKVIGTDVTSGCVVKEWPAEGDISLERSQAEYTSQFRLSALLLDLNADYTKMSSTGQYLIIDGRPISSSRGIGQQISKLYKTYLRSALSRIEGNPSITDPFLCLHIQCPEASYDVNIEPAKDDVLFENPQSLLSLVEDLLRSMYGEKETRREKRSNCTKDKGNISDSSTFDLLLARRSPSEDSLLPTNADPDLLPTSFIPARSLAQPKRVSHGSHVIRSQGSASPRMDGGSGIESRRGSNGQVFGNPWSITKRDAPSRKACENKTVHRPTVDKHSLVSAERRRGSQETPRRYSAGSLLPSPTTSTASASDFPPDSRSLRAPQASPTNPCCAEAKRASRQRARERYGNGALDTWFGKTTHAAFSRMATEKRSDGDQEERPLSQLAHERFQSQEQSSPELYESASRATPTQEGSHSNTTENPVVSCTPPQDLTYRVPLQSSTSEVRSRRQDFPVLNQWSSRLHNHSMIDPKSDLETALDFENRKKEAIQKRREQMKGQSRQSSSTNSPHLSRYLAARADLHSEPNGSTAPKDNSSPFTEVTLKQVLDPHDPRAYLMRSQDTSRQVGQSKDAKVRRINTNKLPFEQIPEGSKLHDVGINLPAKLPDLFVLSEQAYKNDLYTRCGEPFEAFSTSDLQPNLISLWTSRLTILIKDTYNIEGYEILAPQFDFSALTQASSDCPN